MEGVIECASLGIARNIQLEIGALQGANLKLGKSNTALKVILALVLAGGATYCIYRYYNTDYQKDEELG